MRLKHYNTTARMSKTNFVRKHGQPFIYVRSPLSMAWGSRCIGYERVLGPQCIFYTDREQKNDYFLLLNRSCFCGFAFSTDERSQVLMRNPTRYRHTDFRSFGNKNKVVGDTKPLKLNKRTFDRETHGSGDNFMEDEISRGSSVLWDSWKIRRIIQKSMCSPGSYLRYMGKGKRVRYESLEKKK